MAYSTKWMATRKMSTLLRSENNFFSFIKKPRINFESTSAWHKHSVEEYRCSRPSLVISLSRCALCGEFGFLQGGDSNGIVKYYDKYIILQSYHYHECHLNNSCTKCPRHYLYPALQGTDERYNWMKLACTKQHWGKQSQMSTEVQSTHQSKLIYKFHYPTCKTI